MTLPPALLNRPGRLARLAIWLLAIGFITGLGYLHLHSGPAYELHLLFVVPVLLVAWFVSRRRAYVLATLAAILWYLADRQLAGAELDRLVLLVNSAGRLGLLLGAAWMTGHLRTLAEPTRQSTPNHG
jgi:hypothetical protein